MEARAFPPALIIRARSLVSEGLASATAPAAADVEADLEAVRAGYPGRFTFGQTSPRLSHAGLFAAPLPTAVPVPCRCDTLRPWPVALLVRAQATLLLALLSPTAFHHL